MSGLSLCIIYCYLPSIFAGYTIALLVSQPRLWDPAPIGVGWLRSSSVLLQAMADAPVNGNLLSDSRDSGTHMCSRPGEWGWAGKVGYLVNQHFVMLLILLKFPSFARPKKDKENIEP